MSGKPAPECFGKYFSDAATECVGGLDPAYLADDGSYTRPPCPIRGACKSVLQKNAALQNMGKATPMPPAAEVPRGFVPISQVLPPPVAPRPVAPAPPPSAGQMPAPQYNQAPPVMTPTQQPHWQPPVQQQVVSSGGVQYTQPQYAAQPLYVPVNAPMMGAQIPSFLTVPEPYDPDVSYGTRMLRTVTRSMGKAMCISVANFLDYETFGADPRR